MAKVTGYRARERSTTTGTGTYSLAGAEPGFRTIVAAAGTGNTVRYMATDGKDWEVNDGVITDATPDTLTRATLIASSTGSAINWGAGTRDIYLLPPVEGRWLSRQILTVGSGTYTTPPDVKRILIRLVGSGGGGGGTDSAASAIGLGGAGGAGGYSELIIDNPSATYSYTVGAGGTGGSAGANAGNNGNTTSFGTGPLIQATGGGLGAAGAQGTSALARTGGTGGVGSIGTINESGAIGETGYRLSGTIGIGGEGGRSKFGAGGAPVTGSTAGNNGVSYGSGGSGGRSAAVSSDRAGGNGADGVIIVDEYS